MCGYHSDIRNIHIAVGINVGTFDGCIVKSLDALYVRSCKFNIGNVNGTVCVNIATHDRFVLFARGIGLPRYGLYAGSSAVLADIELFAVMTIGRCSLGYQLIIMTECGNCTFFRDTVSGYPRFRTVLGAGSLLGDFPFVQFTLRLGRTVGYA